MVQKLLGQRRTKTRRLTGMVWCGACDRNATPCLLDGMLRCGRHEICLNTPKGRYYRCVSNLDPDCDTPCNTGSFNAVLEDKVWNYVGELLRNPIGTVDAIRQDNGPITQTEEQRITDWCRRTAPLLDGMDNAGKREVLKILGVRVTVEDSLESIQIRLKPHVNPDGDGDDNDNL